MNEFSTTSAQDDAIFQMIVSDLPSDLTGRQSPALYIVMGQPGCGKTELIDIIKAALRKNVLVCNADELRNFHPEFITIARDYELDLPALTKGFADRMNRRLIEYGVSQKFTMIIETTGQGRQMVLETLKHKKEEGYITYLYVLAIPRAFSWLGIHLRFESAKLNLGFGRAVSAPEHDERYTRLRENFRMFAESSQLDHIAVYTRRPLLQPEGKSPLVQLTSLKEMAVSAFFEALDKEMDLNEISAFFEGSSRVVDLMRRREAPEMDIQLFETEARRLGREG